MTGKKEKRKNTGNEMQGGELWAVKVGQGRKEERTKAAEEKEERGREERGERKKQVGERGEMGKGKRVGKTES